MPFSPTSKNTETFTLGQIIRDVMEGTRWGREGCTQEAELRRPARDPTAEGRISEDPRVVTGCVAAGLVATGCFDASVNAY